MQFGIALARASKFFSSHQGVSVGIMAHTGHSNSFTIVCHLLLLPRLRFHEGTLNLCLHFLGSWVAWKTMHFLPLKHWQFLNCCKCLAKSSQPVHSQTSISCTCKIPSISSYNFATLWAQKVWKMRPNGLKAQDAIIPCGGLAIAKHYIHDYGTLQYQYWLHDTWS